MFRKNKNKIVTFYSFFVSTLWTVIHISYAGEDKICFAEDNPYLLDGASNTSNNEQWSDDHFYDFTLRDIDRCDFSRIAMHDINPWTDWNQPLVITNMTTNAHIIDLVSKNRLLRIYGNKDVVLANSVSSSHGRNTVKFKEYVKKMGEKQPLEKILQRDARTTWYLCGDNWWPGLVDPYIKPNWVPDIDKRSSLSFGIGGSASGIPLHKHGQALLEIFSGRKRWFVSPPGTNPPFDKNTHSFKWFHRNKDMDDVWMCTQHVGEGLWLPANWWHATLNIGETVFYLLFT